MSRALLASWWCGWMVVLAGCSTAPVAVEVPAGLLDDSRFAAPATPIDAAGVFAASDAMKRYVREDMAPLLRRLGPQRGLLEAVSRRAQLKLEYDAERTRNAAEAFEARAGNCLALVVMTASFAQELGLPVRYQAVLNQDSWSRSGDLYLRSGHVNLTIGPARGTWAGLYDRADITVDFLPGEDLRRLRIRPIDHATVTAMFMNNRAVETLLQGHVDEAYAWVRAAIRQQPAFLAAYNTLAVLYQRHGDTALAERALAHVLAQAPTDTQAMTNLAQLLDGSGRAAEAAALRQTLRRLEPYPPFAYYQLGREAMARGDYAVARGLFEQEIAREPYYHEFHFWLALASARLGQDAEARKHLALASQYSSTRSDSDLYAAKLARLNATPHP